MSEELYSVDQAAEQLKLHAKTVLRYIRTGRLPATRIGKSYRITRSALAAFAGIAAGRGGGAPSTRVTCVVDIGDLAVGDAERLATLLQSAALGGDAETPPLQVQTAFDPSTGLMKIVLIGCASDVARLLEFVHLHMARES